MFNILSKYLFSIIIVRFVDEKFMKKIIFVILSMSLIFSKPFLTKVWPDEVKNQPEYEKIGPYKVNSLEFPNLKDANRKNRKVPLKVHFPAKGRNFPLVVFSHGGGGNWDSYIYQVRHLASHGYVVICIEHVDSNNKQVKYYKELTGKINTNKIGVMGHSYGAYTTLAICGAQPILDYLEPKVSPGKGLAGDFSDPRVTFGLAMSPQPPEGTYFDKDSYKTINRPLVGISGSNDTWKTFDDRSMTAKDRWQFWELLPNGDKYFLWLENADHFSFVDNPKAWLFPSKSRPDVQRISKAMMVLFCDHFLKEKKEIIIHYIWPVEIVKKYL